MEQSNFSASAGRLSIASRPSKAGASSSLAPPRYRLTGSAAMRPGDVITHYGGKTTEVTNTDAEGRLVLADALALASEGSPNAIVDIATLTGLSPAQVLARREALGPLGRMLEQMWDGLL